jgi:hypothetical protein
MKNNAAAMEKFPALKADLEDAVTAQQRLKECNGCKFFGSKSLGITKVVQNGSW